LKTQNVYYERTVGDPEKQDKFWFYSYEFKGAWKLVPCIYEPTNNINRLQTGILVKDNLWDEANHAFKIPYDGVYAFRARLFYN